MKTIKTEDSSASKRDGGVGDVGGREKFMLRINQIVGKHQIVGKYRIVGKYQIVDK